MPINGVTTSSLRLVMTARPNTHMVVSEIEVLGSVPSTSFDSSLSRISIDGTPIAGFASDVMTYSERWRGKLPAITATPTDPYATVKVTQPTQESRVAVVEVTSEDGTATTTYRLNLNR